MALTDNSQPSLRNSWLLPETDFIALLFASDSHNPEMLGDDKLITDLKFMPRPLHYIKPFNTEEFMYNQ